MDLRLTEEQTFLRDEARRFLAGRAGSPALRKAVEASGGFDAELWRALAGDLGWCGLAIPEAKGGLGAGATEIALLMEEAGRRLACVPLWSTICLAAPAIEALASGPSRTALLGEIAAGSVRAAVALPTLSHAAPLTGLAVSATPSTNGYTLDGIVAHVADLPSATLVLVPARLTDGPIALFALRPDVGYVIRPVETIDPTRPVGELRLMHLDVPAAARIDAGGLNETDFARPLLTARLGLAAEQIGAADGSLDLTRAYVSERVQFGRTIASFQAVKHRCARLFVDIAEARSLLYGAAQSLSEDAAGAERDVAATGVLAVETLWRAAEEAIQLHGGVGNTWEYDPHFYFRRAQVSAFMLGSVDDRLAAIADSVLGEAAA